jgi:hypothetical protein
MSDCFGNRNTVTVGAMSIRSLAVLPVLAAATFLAGCFPVVESITAEQDVGSDEVTISVGICQNQSSTPVPIGCGTDPLSLSADTQMLLGLEVDDEAEFVDGRVSGAFSGALSERDSLRERLNAETPANAGRKWIAVASGSLAAPSGSAATAMATVTRALDAPQLFPYEVVVASRFLGGAAPSSAIPSITGLLTQHLPGLSNTGEVALRDVSLAGPATPVEAQPATTATVPFAVSYRGAAASGALPVGAATGLPGAAATPDATSLTFPSTANRTVNVSVPVPADAPAGDHAVTLQLPLAPGLVRAAFGTLRVVRPGVPQPPNGIPQVQQPGPGPAAAQQGLSVRALRALLNRARVLSTSRGTIARNGLVLRQEFPGPGRAAWELRTVPTGATGSQSGRRGRLLARRTARITKAGRRTIRIRASRRGRRIIRRTKRGRRLALTTTFTDAQGRKVTARRTFRLR